MSDYAKKTVADLTEILKSRGLPHTGKKAELVSRLQENDKSSEATASEPAAAPVQEAPTAAPPSKPAPEPASQPAPTPLTEAPAASDPVATTDTKAPSPDTALASSTNYALNLPTESLDDEAARRKKRAERFGLAAAPEAMNGEADSEAARLAERAKKFGTAGENTGLGKLNEALPMERERGQKRRKEGAEGDSIMDDPGLIRRGRGGRGVRGSFRRGVGGSRGGRRQGTPDGPRGVQKQSAYTSEKDKAAADARKKRFAGGS